MPYTDHSQGIWWNSGTVKQWNSETLKQWNDGTVESGYELRDAPPLEFYLNDPDRTKPENLKTDIYVPVKTL